MDETDGPPGRGPSGWPPPGWTGGPPPAHRPVAHVTTNGLAVASLVLGILWVYWIGSILALVFGYKARRQIDESAGRETGRGMAVAGIVLGWIGVGVLVLVGAAVLAAMAFR